ncbi:MAG: FMN-binding protein [Desulfobacterales bacterium]|nr:FMN-binding protein [Desulfobacterales bacterium]
MTTTSTSNRFQNNYLVQAWLVLLLASLFGFILAGVQATLGPKIEANKVNETREKVPEVILGKSKAQELSGGGGSLAIDSRFISVEKQGKTKIYNVFEARYPDGRVAGWATKVTGQGYADKIELLMGLDSKAENLTGIFILGQKETPGLGNKIEEDAWRGQFSGKSTSQPLRVIKGGASDAYTIDAITGATISSRSVTDIVNTSVNDLKNNLVMDVEQKGKEK